jgi:predicted transcriptional regulator YdeE
VSAVEIVDRPDAMVLGLEVVAPFDELGTAVPAAWRELFARAHELPAPVDGRFAEASEHLGGGRYRETVGVLLAQPITPPAGMTAALLPAGRFVRHDVTGPVSGITDGFQSVYDWAAARGFTLGERTLDRGYTPDGRETVHQLYVDLVG